MASEGCSLPTFCGDLFLTDFRIRVSFLARTNSPLNRGFLILSIFRSIEAKFRTTDVCTNALAELRGRACIFQLCGSLFHELS